MLNDVAWDGITPSRDGAAQSWYIERNLTDCPEVNLLVARRLLSMQLANKSELKNLKNLRTSLKNLDKELKNLFQLT